MTGWWERVIEAVMNGAEKVAHWVLLSGIAASAFGVLFFLSGIAAPFGEMTSERNVAATHLALTCAGLLVLLLLSRDRSGDTGGVGSDEDVVWRLASYLTLVLAASLPVSNIWLVFEWQDADAPERAWMLMLLIPGAAAIGGFFTAAAASDRVDANRRETETATDTDEDTEDMDDLELVQELSKPSLTFQPRLFLKIGTVLGIAYAMILLLTALGPKYVEAVSEAFLSDQFIGWNVLIDQSIRSIGRLWTWVLGTIAICVALIVITSWISHFNQRAAIKPEDAERPFTDIERAFVERAITKLDATLAALPGRNRVRYVLVMAASVAAFFSVMLLGFIPYIFALMTDHGIGASLFEAQRTDGLEQHLYFDGVGGFELGLLTVGGAGAFVCSILVAGLTKRQAAFNWWYTAGGDRDDRRDLILAEIGRGVRRLSTDSTDDTDALQPMARLLWNKARGGYLVMGIALVFSIAAWPLDRAHFAILTNDSATLGPYFPAGLIEERPLTEVESVIDACFEGRDGDAVRVWKIVYPDGREMNLIGNINNTSEEERELILDVAANLRRDGVSFQGRFNASECEASLTALSAAKTTFFQRLYQLNTTPSAH